MQRIYAAAIFALFACASSPVFAQSAPLILPGGCGTASLVTGTGYPTVDSTGKLCVNATVSASITPFTPGVAGARGTPLTVTTADSSGTLPTNGGAVVVTNTGSNPMFCNVNGVAATTSDQEISASGGWFNFGIPAGTTTLHCIATGGSTTANALGGSGLATGTGGGSGGGGGGGNVNVTQWDTTALGVPTAYGTAPTTGNYIGVNAFVTNPVAVTGTFWQATQPVSGTFWQTTQPISVASLPLAPLAATSTKQSDGTQKSQQVDGSGNVAPAGDTAARAGFQKLTDGTNTAAVKAASTGAAATDPSVVTNESPNSQLSVAVGTTADSPCTIPATTTACSQIALAKAQANLLNGPVPLGAASGGMSTKTLAALSNTAIAIKAAAGQVYSAQCTNTDATHWAYIQIFNIAAASVTMGTSAPTKFVGIPPASNAGFTFSLVGDQYSTAISAGAASTATGGTAPTTAIDCTVDFN